MAAKKYSQKLIQLYSFGIPNTVPNDVVEDTIYWEEGVFGGYTNITVPTLELFLPLQDAGCTPAVIFCPGGAYMKEAYQDEGINIARYLASTGIAGIVLKYRLPSDRTMKDKSIGPLQDAQQAIKVIRQKAGIWNIDPRQVGIMGFSAGGHLAATAGTHFSKNYVPNKRSVSLRPDFMALVYPLISMSDRLMHHDSRLHLLGEYPTQDMIKRFSNELQVTEGTPPSWITHREDDSTVSVEHSTLFYHALKEKGVPAEMHLHPTGEHGFALNIPAEEWMGPLVEWIRSYAWRKAL